MDFRVDGDVELLVDSVRAFCKQELEPHLETCEQEGGLSAPVVAQLGAMGLFLLTAPVEHGGANLSRIACLSVIAEVAKVNAGVAWTLAVHNVVGRLAEPVLGLGDHGYEPKAWATGEVLCTVASGPEVHVDGATAHGQVPLVAHAARARVMVVVDPDHGVMVVPADALPSPELACTLGLRSAQLAPLHVDCASGPGQRLGDQEMARSILDDMWLGLVAVAIGTGRAALDEAVAYAEERRQFGVPIASFQGIQWKLSNMATGIEAASLLAHRAATACDRGDRSAHAAVAQAVTATLPAITRMASESLQVFGGYGYTVEYPAERRLRDARTIETLGCVGRARNVLSRDIAARR